jgi:hypothetical protein
MLGQRQIRTPRSSSQMLLSASAGSIFGRMPPLAQVRFGDITASETEPPGADRER